MIKKIKVYSIITAIAIGVAFAGYQIISLNIEKKKLIKTLGQAQEKLAIEKGFHEATIKTLKAKDIENKELREKASELEAIGSKIITEIKVETVEKPVEVIKTIEIEGKTIEVPCKLNLSIAGDIVAVQNVDKSIWWQGYFRIYDSKKLLVELEPDYDNSELVFLEDIVKPKRKWHGWQLGIGFSYDYLDREFRPVVYFGYGINF